MIKLIGTTNCGRCVMVKNILTEKNIEFEYSLIEDLDQEIKDKYFDLAKEANQKSMPLIIQDNKIINLEDV